MASVKQMTFGFTSRPDFSLNNFFEMNCNVEASTAVRGFPTQASEVLVVYGKQGVGKTHLLQAWSQTIGDRYFDISQLAEVPFNLRKIAVDNLSKSNKETQETLFFFYNHIMSEGGALLVSSDTPIAELDLIPELKSRLLTARQIEMHEPASEHLEILLVKWAMDRQIQLDPTVIKYILSRCERKVATLELLINSLDELSLEQKRKITVPLVKEVMQES